MCGHRAKYLRLTGNQGPFSIPETVRAAPADRGGARSAREPRESGSPWRAGGFAETTRTGPRGRIRRAAQSPGERWMNYLASGGRGEEKLWSCDTDLQH